MKKILLVLLLLSYSATGLLSAQSSFHLFAYSTDKDDGRNGLHLAWSSDGDTWHPIGSEYSFVKCDYGRWGQQKRMVDPCLFRDRNGLWHLLWTLNETDGAFAHAASEDLVHWQRQSYREVIPAGNCLLLTVEERPQKGDYRIGFKSSVTPGDTLCYEAITTDFKTYTFSGPIAPETYRDARRRVFMQGKEEWGVVNSISRTELDYLLDAQRISAYRQQLHAETTTQDSVRFAGLDPLDLKIEVDHCNAKPISDLLIGIFFEDINYAADGGLYAELVQNRGFEYDPSDQLGRDPSWNATKAWSVRGDAGALTIATEEPLHPHNPHYAVLRADLPGSVALVNEGFDGIALKAGEAYDFSCFARRVDGRSSRLTVRLVGPGGEVYAQGRTTALDGHWKKYRMTLTASRDVADAVLELIPELKGSIAVDMISLFPQKTFKNRPNGLRADLAQTLADMKPRFVRFPGGCVAHGDGLENMYLWKNTIGPLEARKPQRNIWNYHQSVGLGYYEYFQFCEDIGAEPVPIVPAGVPCQNSAHHGHSMGGQQGGVPLCDMEAYIQDVLDLVEWANGDANTTWGRKRAEAGHPAPFGLKYIGVGNEDQITDVFEERFTMIYRALQEKHPEITVIGTAGPFYEGTDYDEGWALADRLSIPVMDEHYYNPPGWFIHNQDFYDKYDRSKSKVYLGEYAAHLPGRPVNVETALAEALYLTALERNGDVVCMSSYAPLLAKEGHTQWNPDLIYFNNTEVKPTVGYYVQQLYGNNTGDRYLFARVSLSSSEDAVRKRVGVSVVQDSDRGEVIVKLVNLLPVALRATVDLGGFVPREPQAVKTVLTGEPTDREAKPTVYSIPVGTVFPEELPPYSLTVIRMR